MLSFSMSITLYRLHTTLTEIIAKYPNQFSYQRILSELQCVEIRKTLEILIGHCNNLLESAVILDKDQNSLILLDNLRIICSSETNNQITVQIKHYGQWCNAPDQKNALKHANVLYHRVNQKFTLSDFNLMRLFPTIAIKEYFYQELSENIPNSLIQQKLNNKSSKHTLIDYELYEFQHQEVLITKVVDTITRLWLSSKNEKSINLNTRIICLSETIKSAFLSVLDRDMKELLSVLPEPTNIVGYYELYQSVVSYKESLLKWRADSPQRLMYVLLNKEQGISIDDPSYFSHSNLLDPNVHRTFLDKVSIRRVFQVDLSILGQLLVWTPQNYNNYKNFFSLWTFWLGHTKHSDINPHVFRVLSTLELHSNFNKENTRHIKILKKHGVPLLDLLYTFLLEQLHLYDSLGQTASFVDSFMFNDSYEYFDDDNLPNELRKQRRKINSTLNEIADFILSCENADQSTDMIMPNLLRVSPKTNMNSLSRNAHIWHVQAQKREMGPLSIWKQFKPFSADIEGYTFTLITDNHQLFYEGVEMKHCVYTFETKICSDMYIVFTLKSKAERGTVGLAIGRKEDGSPCFHLHQIKGEANDQLSKKANDCAIKLSEKINSNPDLIYVDGCFPNVQEFIELDQEAF